MPSNGSTGPGWRQTGERIFLRSPAPRETRVGGGNVALEPVSLKDAHWRVGERAGLHLLNALGLGIIPTRVDFVLIDVKKAYTGRR